jgi:hypothetical protein
MPMQHHQGEMMSWHLPPGAGPCARCGCGCCSACPSSNQGT